MPFVIVAMGTNGAVSVERDTAAETLEKVLDLEAAGYQHIEVKDGHGKNLTRDEVTILSKLQGDN
jgi:hypothetical protein